MLRETSRFRNYGGCANRRSFTDSDMDLYVWFNDQVPARFHLTYNKQGHTRSISWNNETGFDQWRFAQVEALAAMLGFPDMLDFFYMHDTGSTELETDSDRALPSMTRRRKQHHGYPEPIPEW